MTRAARPRSPRFDLNAEVVKRLKAPKAGFAVDQQPYLQGCEAIEELWRYRTNGSLIGGGTDFTCPAVVTERDVPQPERFTARGTADGVHDPRDR